MTVTNPLVGEPNAVHVSPVGTAAPIDSDTVLAAPWVDLGCIDEDTPPTLTGFEADTTRHYCWNNSVPIRTSFGNREPSIGLGLAKFDETALQMYFGSDATFTAGATATPGPAAPNKMTIPSSLVPLERALTITFTDGIDTVRMYFARATVGPDGDIDLSRQELMVIPVKLDILQVAGSTDLGEIFWTES